jgi:dihydrofolate synthase/folylpolyglutamate synthase
MQFLGNTLPEIAFEKAGIIKETVPVVIGEYQEEVFEVFQTKAIEMDTNIVIASQNINIDFESDLKGSYQKQNIKTAVQTISILKQKGYSIAQENIKNGLLNVVKNTGLLGRWQVLQIYPKIICDTGHNEEGLHYIFQQIAAEKFEKLHIVLGVVNDKDLASILPMFPKNAEYYFCKPNIPRGLDAQELYKVAAQFDLKGEVFKNVHKALNAAKDSASKKDLIFVGGSTFVVAEVV